MINKILKKGLLFTAVIFIAAGTAMAQSGKITTAALSSADHSVALKTIRSMFPNTPTVVANDMFGGFHSVIDIDALHGFTPTGASDQEKLDIINDAELQVGMVVYVESLNTFYVYSDERDGTIGTAPFNASAASVGDAGANATATNVNGDYWKSLYSVIDESVAEKVTFSQTNTRLDYVVAGFEKNTFSAQNSDPKAGDTHSILSTDGKNIIQSYTYSGSVWILVSETPYSQTAAGDPSTANTYIAGDIYTNSTSGETSIYTGSQWVPVNSDNTIISQAGAPTVTNGNLDGDIVYDITNKKTYAYDSDATAVTANGDIDATDGAWVLISDDDYTQVAKTVPLVQWVNNSSPLTANGGTVPTDSKVGDIIKLDDGHSYVCTTEGDATASRWMRLSRNANVIVATEVDNPTLGATTPTGTIANAGDIQIVNATGVNTAYPDDSYVTYVYTTAGDWKEIARYIIEQPATTYAIYEATAPADLSNLPDFDTSVTTDFATLGAAATTQSSYIESATATIKNSATGVIIYYPAHWDVSFLLGPNKFELASGITPLGVVTDANTGTTKVSGDYKVVHVKTIAGTDYAITVK